MERDNEERQQGERPDAAVKNEDAIEKKGKKEEPAETSPTGSMMFLVVSPGQATRNCQIRDARTERREGWSRKSELRPGSGRLLTSRSWMLHGRQGCCSSGGVCRGLSASPRSRSGNYRPGERLASVVNKGIAVGRWSNHHFCISIVSAVKFAVAVAFKFNGSCQNLECGRHAIEQTLMRYCKPGSYVLLHR